MFYYYYYYYFFFFSRKRYPFRIPSISDKWCPFHIPCLELCIPFDCCKCTVFFSFFYIEINLKNSMYTDVLFFYFVPTPLHWRSKNPLRFISYHPRSADFEKEIESLLTGHLKNRRFSRLFKAISFIY